MDAEKSDYCKLLVSTLFMAVLLSVPLACYVCCEMFSNGMNCHNRFFIFAACLMLTIVLLFLIFQQCRFIAYKEAKKCKESILNKWNETVGNGDEERKYLLEAIKKNTHGKASSLDNQYIKEWKDVKIDEMTALAIYHPDTYFQVKTLELWKSLLEKQHELLKDNPAYVIFGRAND